MLRGARNALVIPKGRAIIIDNDDARAEAELAAAGLPETLTIDSPTPGHSHVYGWVPEGIDMATIPGAFTWGEVRRHDPRTRTASMVLGPWSLRTDGIYTPRGDVRTIAALPASVIDYLIGSAAASGRRRGRRPVAQRMRAGSSRTGGMTFLIARARNLRGVGMTGERLFDELVRIDRERCSPPRSGRPARRHRRGSAASPAGRWTTSETTRRPSPRERRGLDPPASTPRTSWRSDLPPLRMIVPGLLPEGTSVLVAPPKVGKSCLVYQIA